MRRIRLIDVENYPVTVIYDYGNSIDLEEVEIHGGDILPILSIDFVGKIIKKLEAIEEKEERHGPSLTRMSDYR
jgi:hypothetical protein